MGLSAGEKLQVNASGRSSPRLTIPAFYGPSMSPAPAPFRFTAHHTRINWQVLHGVDIDKLVSRTSPFSLPLQYDEGMLPLASAHFTLETANMERACLPRPVPAHAVSGPST